jgi:hypothetical protein
MDLTSPVIIATILGFIFTQIVGRVVDHHYDRNYRQLERNLQLKKLLGEDTHNASLDELIRRQLNSYVLYEMGDVRTERKHRLYLSGIGVVALGSLVLTITLFQEKNIGWAIASIVLNLAMASLYYDRKRTWFQRVPAENTKYKAELKGGMYDGGVLMLDIMPVGNADSTSTLDHPYIFVEDSATARLHSYKRIRSTGTVSIAAGEDTDLVTEYEYQGLYDGEEGRRTAGKNPIVSSLIVKRGDNETYEGVESLVIVKPIKGAYSLLARMIRFVNSKLKRKHHDEEVNGEPVQNIPE